LFTTLVRHKGIIRLDQAIPVVIQRLGIHPHPNAETQFGFPDAQVIRIRGLYLKIVLWPQLVIHYVATEAASQLKNRRSKADHLCGGSASVATAGYVAQQLAPVKGCKTC